MSQDSSSISRAAQALADAREQGKQIPRVSDTFGISSVADAYKIQEINTDKAIARGRRLVGRKIGLTSPAVQQQLGVDQPDFGMLFADMEVINGGTVNTKNLIQPKAEAEIAFVLSRDLPREDTSMVELLSAIDYILPAIEIVDSAIADWKITLIDTVADNASSGCYVLGNEPIKLDGQNLTLEGMLLYKNGELVSQGIGAACLGNPLNACLWLARTMAQVGRPLLAGDLLLSGALGPMVNVSAGDRLHMQLTRLGDLHCDFANHS